MNFDLTAFLVFVSMTTLSGVIARHGILSATDAQRWAFVAVRIVAGLVVAFAAPAAGLGWWQVAVLMAIRELALVAEYLIARIYDGMRVRREADKWLQRPKSVAEIGERQSKRRMIQ